MPAASVPAASVPAASVPDGLDAADFNPESADCNLARVYKEFPAENKILLTRKNSNVRITFIGANVFLKDTGHYCACRREKAARHLGARPFFCGGGCGYGV
ncbi:MAG: hypothetical protein LBQ14_10595 [Treponema sp.]|jgi:hypothetical protein|nr:hypothetical protein [Treponema sp.]